jgi:hypothetical protein
MGSSIDDFLREEGIFEEVQAQAIREAKRAAARELDPMVAAGGASERTKVD